MTETTVPAPQNKGGRPRKPAPNTIAEVLEQLNELIESPNPDATKERALTKKSICSNGSKSVTTPHAKKPLARRLRTCTHRLKDSLSIVRVSSRRLPDTTVWVQSVMQPCWLRHRRNPPPPASPRS